MRTTTRISLFLAGAAASGAVAYTLTTLARTRRDLHSQLREIREEVARIAQDVGDAQGMATPSSKSEDDGREQATPPSDASIASDGRGELLARALDNGSTLDDLEGEYIRVVLERADGNRSQAARVLGIDRRTLYRKLLRHGIPDQDP
ncbi:MAG: helix-turn-helix domain-containing protein [Candidatus Latescibacteria bacterium]|nr:helix-turn-helix domain-containing protein [Candidatus Latescibacterota bacterium]